MEEDQGIERLNWLLKFGTAMSGTLRGTQQEARTLWNRGQLWVRITEGEEEAVGRIGMVTGMIFDSGAGRGWCFLVQVLACGKKHLGRGDGFHLWDTREWTRRYWAQRKLEFLTAKPITPFIGTTNEVGQVFEEDDGIFHVINNDRRHYLVDAKAWLGNQGQWKKEEA